MNTGAADLPDHMDFSKLGDTDTLSLGSPVLAWPDRLDPSELFSSLPQEYLEYLEDETPSSGEKLPRSSGPPRWSGTRSVADADLDALNERDGWPTAPSRAADGGGGGGGDDDGAKEVGFRHPSPFPANGVGGQISPFGEFIDPELQAQHHHLLPPAKPEGELAMTRDEALPLPAEPMLPPHSWRNMHVPGTTAQQLGGGAHPSSATTTTSRDLTYTWQRPARQKKSKGERFGRSALAHARSGDGELRDLITAEAKMKASRDRNRQHARNTRLRKKEYIQQLEQSVSELSESLSAERQRIVQGRRVQEDLEEKTRREVLHALGAVLQYRAQGERDRRNWLQYISPRFTFCLPITPYRSFNPEETTRSAGASGVPGMPGGVGSQRVIRGVDEMIAESCSYRVLLQSACVEPTAQSVRASYHLAPDTIVSSDTVMCRWMMVTENAVECGASCELFKTGMLRAKFRRRLQEDDTDSMADEGAASGETYDPEALPLAPHSMDQDSLTRPGMEQPIVDPHEFPVELTRLDMLFDVMSFMQLLTRMSSPNKASRRIEFPVIPNTLHLALKDGLWAGNEDAASIPKVDLVNTLQHQALSPGAEQEARVITKASAPFQITHVNSQWCSLCGFRADEAVGNTLSMIQGPETDMAAIANLCDDVRARRASAARVVNYKKDGSVFLNYIRVFPLWKQGSASHFLGILEEIPCQHQDDAAESE